MVPSRSSLPALTAFARPGPGASRSPTSSLVFGHPTPSTSLAPAHAGRPPVFPWASLPRADASSARRTVLAVTPADRASVPVGASEAGHRSPMARIFPEEGRGPPRLLGCPPGLRAAVPHPAGPPWARLYRPPEMLRSGMPTPSAPTSSAFSGLSPCGPHPRLPTHQPPRCRDDCKVGYRPAG